MQYYIQSAGQTLESEYRWYKIEDHMLQPFDFNLIEEIKIKLPLDLESSTLLLYRNNEKKLCLLISALATNRKDSRNRDLRNSLVWISDSSEDDLKLQGIANQYLKDFNKLEIKVNDFIRLDNHIPKIGFNVDIPALEEFTSSYIIKNVLNKTNLENKIAKNTEVRRIDLAKELSESELPECKGELVLVEEYGNPKVMNKSITLWRGLSGNETSEQWRSKEIPTSPIINKDVIASKEPYSMIDIIKYAKVIIIIFILIIILIIVFISKKQEKLDINNVNKNSQEIKNINNK